MSDELKASLFSVSYFVFFALSSISCRFDIFGWITLVYLIIVIASAKMEKQEERLKMYKEDADRRLREELTEQSEEIAHEQHITMTKIAA